MEKCKTCKLISIAVFLMIFCFFCEAESTKDIFDGIWTNWDISLSECDPCLSIEKLKEEEYFVSYSCEYEKHVGDFCGIAVKVAENKLLFRAAPIDGHEELYYIYYDSQMDYMYVLWNHEIPDAVYYDVKLERVSKLFGPDALTPEEIKAQEQKKLEESILEYFRQGKQNE